MAAWLQPNLGDVFPQMLADCYNARMRRYGKQILCTICPIFLKVMWNFWEAVIGRINTTASGLVKSHSAARVICMCPAQTEVWVLSEAILLKQYVR